MSRQRRAVLALSAALALAAGCADEPADPGAAPPGGASPGAASPGPDGGASGSPGATASPDAAQGGEPVARSGDELEGATTELVLGSGFLAALRTAGLDVSAVGEARREGDTVVLPVTGGDVRLDPAAAEPLDGTLEHAGGLSLSGLGRTVEVTGLRVDGAAGEVTAEVAGRRLPLLTLDEAGAGVERQGDATVLSGTEAVLRREAVAALTERLGLPTLPELPLGELRVVLPEQP